MRFQDSWLLLSPLLLPAQRTVASQAAVFEGIPVHQGRFDFRPPLQKGSGCLFAIDLARGDETATIWTTDFSYDYVKINAEYRT